jgi:hypothetical protein
MEAILKKSLLLLFVLFFLLICFAGCSSKSTEENDKDVADTDEVTDYDNKEIMPICKTPGDGPYELKFRDATEELGLLDMDVTGSQITVADINNNGWPDIYVTMAGKLREDPEDPKGYYRLLKNMKGEGLKDITFESGLFKDRSGNNGLASTFVVFADMNNNGFMDALNVVYVDQGTYGMEGYKEDYTRVYLNNGDGTFKPGPTHKFHEKIYEPISGVTFFDYNKDGILDFFASRQYGRFGYLDSCEQDSLYKGLGDGKFENITEGSGLETVAPDDESLAAGKNHRPAWGVTACDVDGNGYADIMVTNYGRSFNSFYLNKGDGKFEDISLSSNFASDDNEDYSDDQFFRCYCAEDDNKDTDYCKDAPSPSIMCSQYSWSPGFSDQPYRLGGNSAGTLCADFTGNGKMDLFSLELAHWHIGGASDKSQLMANNNFPNEPFERVDEKDSGITRSRSGSWDDGDMGGLAVDFDNDGRMDIYIMSSDYPGTTSLLYQQQNDSKFKEVVRNSGSLVERAHGGAFVDIDRDGDYDLIVGVSFMRWGADTSDYSKRPEKQWIRVFKNETGQDSNRVMIDLVGSGKEGMSNSKAIGAKITVRANGKEFVREVQSSYGLMGFQNDLFQIIGIGDICEVDEIEIRWPDKNGTVTKYENIYANYVLRIHEEDGLSHHTLEDYFNKNSVEAGE